MTPEQFYEAWIAQGDESWDSMGEMCRAFARAYVRKLHVLALSGAPNIISGMTDEEADKFLHSLVHGGKATECCCNRPDCVLCGMRIRRKEMVVDLEPYQSDARSPNSTTYLSSRRDKQAAPVKEGE